MPGVFHVTCMIHLDAEVGILRVQLHLFLVQMIVGQAGVQKHKIVPWNSLLLKDKSFSKLINSFVERLKWVILWVHRRFRRLVTNFFLRSLVSVPDHSLWHLVEYEALGLVLLRALLTYRSKNLPKLYFSYFIHLPSTLYQLSNWLTDWLTN
jgi:hypothetical protein